MICERVKPRPKPVIVHHYDRLKQHFNRLKPENPAVDIQFFKTLHDGDGYIRGFEDRSKQPRYLATLIGEISNTVKGGLRDGYRHSRCYFYRLPVDVRMRIYQYVFTHDFSPLEIGRLERSGVGDLAILRLPKAFPSDIQRLFCEPPRQLPQAFTVLQ
ncbi:hypothetical protein BDV06DRAFT_223136 [Aspergillus oleicola]